MGVVVGCEVGHSRHLQHEEHRGPVALRHRPHQLMQMLYAPFRGGIRKTGVAVFLQRHALYLHQVQSRRCGQTEVQPGRAVDKLRLHIHRRGIERPGELAEHPVGRLGIHVDQQAVLVHGDEIEGRPARRVLAPLQIYRRAGPQQLPAAPGVLHVAHRLRAVYLHQGDETVGPRQEAALHHFSVPHRAASSLFV